MLVEFDADDIGFFIIVLLLALALGRRRSFGAFRRGRGLLERIVS